ncbi:hypothetical protein SNE40_005292 [Patella caerulea]|uniref:C-type lectin domain-containing protein n=1 Tax=Patella caerulea TaxID=87958 RepID=A0AAN8JWQ7_PATCE
MMNINMGRILWILQLFVILAIGGVIPNDVIQFTNDNSNSDDIVVKAAERLMDDPSFLIKVKALMEYTAIQDGYTMNENGEAEVDLRALIKINLTELLRLLMTGNADLFDSTLCSGTVNGGWGEWSDYDDCSATCGPGTKTRSRQCDNPPPSNGGDVCAGDNTETTECNLAMCPVNGGWGEWLDYGDCSATCGTGSKTRSRQCNNPPPSNDGEFCEGDDTETAECNLPLCPVNGGWGEWLDYGDCSVTCGPGTKTRSRQCDNPPPSNDGDVCEGDNTETTECNLAICPEDKCLSYRGFKYDSASETCILLSNYITRASTANYVCNYHGLRLYKMDTLEKIAFLKRTVIQHYREKNWYSYGVFVGAFDTGNGNFKWLDGTSVTWYSGWPLSYGQQCLRLDTRNWEMDETWCSNRFQFACEKIV